MKTVPLKINHKHIKDALRIRIVEEKFLQLFSEGKLNGTVHTCVGQEFSALAFAGQLKKRDFVFSNHRCHGHYIAFTADVRGLLAELMGKASGTSGGIGSSQHLCHNNFFSNGIQGGIVPVAAGYALGNKLKENGAIGVVYIGDGTLGEGALYETMNIISKWNIPLLIVCENNFYAQSTPQSVNLAGDIQARAEAFGIRSWKGNTWSPDQLMDEAQEAINYVRSGSKPGFFLVETYRLNAHSKGDDDRTREEVEEHSERDFINQFSKDGSSYFKMYHDGISAEVDALVADILLESEQPIADYYQPATGNTDQTWLPLSSVNKRQVELINTFFRERIATDDKLIFIGEDILSPYGGAFKVAKDLSFIKPGQVFSTPISEAAIMGISNGLALNGFKPFAEIMFGDFMTLAFDQIVNHASKFHHMFNKKVNCPVVVRTAMGGHRGYGPTHSQTLDKFLIGIDNVKTVAINTLFDPTVIYESIYKEQHPVILIENKVDYGKKILANPSKHFVYERSTEQYPVVRIRPAVSEPALTIVAYGGMADMLAPMLEQIFLETDQKPELIVPSLISDLPIDFVVASVQKTRRLVMIEEGSGYGGIGSELIAAVSERIGDGGFKTKRISAMPVPIPSVKSLEQIVLPEKNRIIKELKESFL
ncbi:pyruvate dehydrogenase [Segetibacter sp. 3557_3]|uniref:dehydrogenase E1 component subunit alpha/beta n=1 Tax=Segetibacter sp. 3557_3 TaxID=2547429 RepID=UPI0010584914|nr:alpha-ketoacid dehydrogenase subunit alpha/beta [Segetibacter sp. 3557_3]TDH23315.1 pyruvate dehydrogenase [Segetibacter sp. 3557_3]